MLSPGNTVLFHGFIYPSVMFPDYAAVLLPCSVFLCLLMFLPDTADNGFPLCISQACQFAFFQPKRIRF